MEWLTHAFKLDAQPNCEELPQMWVEMQKHFVHAIVESNYLSTNSLVSKLWSCGTFEAVCTMLMCTSHASNTIRDVLTIIQKMLGCGGKDVSTAMDYPVLRRLMDLNRHADAEVRTLSISILARVDNKEQMDRLGFFDNCLEMVTRNEPPLDDAELGAFAVALINFSMDVERQKKILNKVSFERLMKWAESPRTELKTCSAAFVANLIANDDCKPSIVSHGGLTVLLMLLDQPDSPPSKKHAIRGLANLALGGDSHQAIIDAGGALALAKVFAEADPHVDVLRNACRCLSYLSAGKYAGQTLETIVEPDLIEKLILWENSDNADLQKHAKRVNENMAAFESKSQKNSPFFKKSRKERANKMLERRLSSEDLVGKSYLVADPAGPALGLNGPEVLVSSTNISDEKLDQLSELSENAWQQRVDDRSGSGGSLSPRQSAPVSPTRSPALSPPLSPSQTPIASPRSSISRESSLREPGRDSGGKPRSRTASKLMDAGKNSLRRLGSLKKNTSYEMYEEAQEPNP